MELQARLLINGRVPGRGRAPIFYCQRSEMALTTLLDYPPAQLGSTKMLVR
jgi:hypothetical protein